MIRKFKKLEGRKYGDVILRGVDRNEHGIWLFLEKKGSFGLLVKISKEKMRETFEVFRDTKEFSSLIDKLKGRAEIWAMGG